MARLLGTSGATERGDLAAARPAGAGAGVPAGVPADGESAEGRTAARRSARRWGLLVGAGWLVLVALRAWFSRAQTVPLANPDESAYLIAARVLAGGPAADFSYSTLYQGGYPLLITPVFWFTHNPVTAYRGVLMVNALISAGLMPLAYVAGRRLGLGRPAAYGVALATALLPAGFFYAEYAMTDAIFPVLILAWLLTVHSWLTARTRRGRYAAAAGSAVLVGYAYAVHSRGLVILVGYLAVGAAILWRRLAPRGTVAVAALATAASVGAGWLLDRYLSWAIYPEGTRSLSGEMASRLRNVHEAINVFEMAAGQLWRLVLDSWGLAGIGLFAAIAVIAWPKSRADVRIMAALSVAVTLVTAGSAPAALPSDQSATWASGRYLDGMIVTFFLVGAVVLLRCRPRFVAICAACTVALSLVTAGIVAVYAGSSLPTSIFPTGFNFAEPAVLTQDWTSANVWVATAVALGLLGLWISLALAARRWSAVVVRPGARPSRAPTGAQGAAGRLGGRARGGQPGGRGPGDEPCLAGRHAGSGGQHDRVRGGQRAQAGREGRGGQQRQLLAVGAAGVRGVLDRAGIFQPSPGAAGRDGRGRGGLASRPARVGQLAARPGRVAHRRRQPGRRLGGVAALVRTGRTRRAAGSASCGVLRIGRRRYGLG